MWRDLNYCISLRFGFIAMGAQTECVLLQMIVVTVNSSICFKGAVTEPSIMFLTSAKDVAVEYKYVWCNTRSCMIKAISDVGTRCRKSGMFLHPSSHCLVCYIRGYLSIQTNIQRMLIHGIISVRPTTKNNVRITYATFICLLSKVRARVSGNECC